MKNVQDTVFLEIRNESSLELLATEMDSRRLGASTKSHASEKIKNHYFCTLRTGSDVFFDADSESPHMT